MDNSIASTPYYESRVDYASIALPVLIWIIAVMVINPHGNFPLDDDWSFSLSVRHMLESHEFRPLGWTSMSLLGQTVWGALFCLPAGFSFFALRVSTLVAGALGVAACAMLLQQAGCDKRRTIVATIVFGFNPIYFVLSATFMTDVPFAVTCVFSTFFFWRYLQRRHLGLLVVAILFAIWSILIRQLGLFLPLAMFLTLLAESRREVRAILLSLGGFVASMVVLKALSVWLNAHNAMPPVYLDKTPVLVRMFPGGVITLAALSHKLGELSWFLRAALEQMGLALFPLLVWRLPALVREYLRHRWGKLVLLAATLGGAAWIVAQMVVSHHIMPYNTWTVVQASGLGPIWLWDAFDGLDVTPLPDSFWLSATLLGIVGAVILLLDLALIVLNIVAAHRARRADATTSLHTFLLLGVCIYVAPCVLTAFYDRYMLPAVFPLIALVVTGHRSVDTTRTNTRLVRPSRLPWTAVVNALGVFTLVTTIAFSIAGTHDYLAWNRARWLLIDTLLQRGVPVTKIDGGYEFNGLYMYDPKFDILKPHSKSWWAIDNEYVIQFMPRRGYREIDSADTGGWLSPLQTRIVTLQRETP